MPLRHQRLLLAVCVLIGAGVFFSGIDWGLPSKLGDLYFFNGHPVMKNVTRGPGLRVPEEEKS